MGITHTWQRLWRREARPARQARARRVRPALEALEDRTVPATYFVAPGGADVAGGGGAANPFRSIQYAVNRAAATGDTVLVAAGAYTYNAAADLTPPEVGTTAVVVVYNKQLVLRGGYNAANWAAPPDPLANPSVIDGQGSRRGVLVAGIDATRTAAAVNLENFTIQNGLALPIPGRGGDDAVFGFGGGLFVDLGSQQQLPVAQVFRNLVFRFNAAYGGNTAGAVGGGAGGGAMALRYAAHVFMDNVTFQHNQAAGGTGGVRGGGAFGGALNADHSHILSAVNLTFANNLATGGAGGGVGVTDDGQRADALGGAVVLQSGSSMNLGKSVVTGNVALGGNAGNQAGGGYGGGIGIDDASLTLTDSVVSGNVAQGGTGSNDADPGRGIPAGGGGAASGGGILAFNSNLLLDRVGVVGNRARGGASRTAATTGFYGAPSGGGLFLANFVATPHAAVLVNTVVADNGIEFNTDAGLPARPESFNFGGGGGGFWIQGLPTQVTHSTVANNVLGPNLFYGSALLLYPGGTQPGSTTAHLTFSIIANHSNPPGNAALQVWGDGGASLARVLFAGNTQNTSTFGPPGTTPGTITGIDPTLVATSAMFVAPGSDYHLLGTSPARNQAAGSPLGVDRDNLPRDGSPDLGAHEVPPSRVQLSAARHDTFDDAAGLTVTLTRTGDTTGPSSVTFWTGGGSATPGEDYDALGPVVVTFDPGQTTKAVTVTLRNGPGAEPGVETFHVFLGNPSAGTVLDGPSSAVVNLVDDHAGDLAGFISGVYHTLLNRAAGAAEVATAYHQLYPAFAGALAARAATFLTSREYYGGLAAGAYQAFLGRIPSAGEADLWAARAQATSAERMLAEVVGSGEAFAHNGGDPGSWLSAAFEGLLGRPLAPGEAVALIPLLDPARPATFVNLAFGILQSPEYRASLVHGAFAAFLGRAPLPAEGGYVASLAALLATQPRQVMAAQLLSSPEYFLAAGNDVAGWVGRLYADLLGRSASPGELAAHRGGVLNAFAASREAFATGVLNGTEYRTLVIHKSFVDVLGHAPSAGQVSQWLGLLAGGWTAAQFRAALFGSEEYFVARAGNSVSGWLNQVYLDILGRPIDPGAAVVWSGQLNGGQTRQAVAGLILASGEYHDRLTAAGYQQVFGRGPGAGEVGVWRNAWAQGLGDVRFLALLLAAQEFFTAAHPYP